MTATRTANEMKKIFAAVALAIIVSPCLAEGWSDLSGKNRNGDTINVYPAWDADNSRDYSIEENRELFYVDVYKGGKASEGTSRTHKDQRCKFTEDKAGNRIRFSCENSGKSPLSGATYRIVPNSNPEDCSYQAEYHCISGCDSPTTPRIMTKSYWECE